MTAKLPATKRSLVVRTDFSNEPAWSSVCAEIEAPQTADNFQASVEFLDDRAFENATIDELLALDRSDFEHGYLFVVDQTTLSDPEHPILAIDFADDVGRTLRVIPSEMWGIENNLFLANMDFRDFADNADPDGVFRGFKS